MRTAVQMTQSLSAAMAAWSKHETASRSTCPECHFESSEGYLASHAPGCTSDEVIA